MTYFLTKIIKIKSAPVQIWGVNTQAYYIFLLENKFTGRDKFKHWMESHCSLATRAGMNPMTTKINWNVFAVGIDNSTNYTESLQTKENDGYILCRVTDFI